MSVIITKSVSKLEPALRSKAFAFVEKLNDDPALPGLHIEPIHNSVDSRVRTGRVDQGYRAVLFQLTRPENVDYVLHGIWPHDDAIAMAKKVRLTVNPISGVPEIIEQGEPAAPEPSPPAPSIGGTGRGCRGRSGLPARGLRLHARRPDRRTSGSTSGSPSVSFGRPTRTGS